MWAYKTHRRPLSVLPPPTGPTGRNVRLELRIPQDYPPAPPTAHSPKSPAPYPPAQPTAHSPTNCPPYPPAAPTAHSLTTPSASRLGAPPWPSQASPTASSGRPAASLPPSEKPSRPPPLFARAHTAPRIDRTSLCLAWPRCSKVPRCRTESWSRRGCRPSVPAFSDVTGFVFEVFSFTTGIVTHVATTAITHVAQRISRLTYLFTVSLPVSAYLYFPHTLV